MMLTVAPAIVSSSTVRRFVAWASALLLALVVLVASLLVITVAAQHADLLGTVRLVPAGSDLPLEQWLLMQQAAATSGCGLDWSILAGLEKEESDFGRDPKMYAPHDGGIVGLVQMQPGNWAIFAPPGGNPFEPHDALTAAARFLCVHGAGRDLRGALFAYNHLDSYVADVLRWAQVYAAVLGPALGTPTTTGTGGPPGGGSSVTVGAEIVGVARTWLGVPYVWGGTGPYGYDCSGLMQYALGVAGIRMPRVAADQARTGVVLPYSQARIGDLLIFANDPTNPGYISHIAMYVGGGKMLEAPHTGDVVKISPAWGASQIAAIRRIVPS
jgi:hypothetical protein